MDIWEKLYNAAKKEYHPEQVSPFIDAHHVVCAIEAEDGQIFTGFCIEGRVVLLHYVQNVLLDLICIFKAVKLLQSV